MWSYILCRSYFGTIWSFFCRSMIWVLRDLRFLWVRCSRLIVSLIRRSTRKLCLSRDQDACWFMCSASISCYRSLRWEIKKLAFDLSVLISFDCHKWRVLCANLLKKCLRLSDYHHSFLVLLNRLDQVFAKTSFIETRWIAALIFSMIFVNENRCDARACSWRMSVRISRLCYEFRHRSLWI